VGLNNNLPAQVHVAVWGAWNKGDSDPHSALRSLVVAPCAVGTIATGGFLLSQGNANLVVTPQQYYSTVQLCSTGEFGEKHKETQP
jgi:hypothetical protein